MSKPYVNDMERFISMAQQHNIELILVNMPVTKRFRDYWRDGGTKIEQYRRLLASIARRHHIKLIDYYDAPPQMFDPLTAFRDTNHLSKAGAKIITEAVIDEQLVPLLRRRSQICQSAGRQ
jgi:hypothetical protein